MARCAGAAQLTEGAPLMSTLECESAGTLRQMAHFLGEDMPTAPDGAKHVSLWTCDGKRTVVFERGARCWNPETGAWEVRESHYQARRNLNRGV